MTQIKNLIAANKRKTGLLIIIFILFVLALGWFLGQLNEQGYNGLILAGVISAVFSLAGYFYGDKIALSVSGARGPIKETDNPELSETVRALCQEASIPIPKLYIINDGAPNAFACGRDPRHASVALTTGIIEKLNKDELSGVISHELSHIKNFDIRLATVVIVLVGVVSLISNWLLRLHFVNHRGNRDRPAHPIMLLIGFILAIFAPLCAELIRLTISRKREFLADASGASLTRNPLALANALEKISAVNIPLRRTSEATAHLYIVNPFGKTKKFLASAFSTHPPIEERIKILKNL